MNLRMISVIGFRAWILQNMLVMIRENRVYLKLNGGAGLVSFCSRTYYCFEDGKDKFSCKSVNIGFKFCLMQHYKDLTKEIYNPEDPRTFKSVCVKCHTTCPLTNLSNRACCYIYCHIICKHRLCKRIILEDVHNL